jgi:hypothetical protein
MRILFDDAIGELFANRKHLLNELAMHDRAVYDYENLIALGDELSDFDLMQIYKKFTHTLRKRQECKNRLDILRGLKKAMGKTACHCPKIIMDEFKRYENKLTVKLATYELDNSEFSNEDYKRLLSMAEIN